MRLQCPRFAYVGLLTVILFAAVSHAQTTQPAVLTPDWTPLFNGKDLSGFYTFVNREPRNVDPDGYYKVTDGMIHVLGIPATEARKEFGFFATEKSYSNYHLRAQYKWGKTKFAPRLTQPRDSGVLFHMNDTDRIWPRSIECQVQEGDTGEMIIVGNNLEVTIPTKARGNNANQRMFDPAGTPTAVNRGRVYKQPVADKLDDWNTVEVITRGDSAVHIVNGVVMMSITNMKMTDTNQPLTSGRIVFQAEGAELFYRNIEIRGLKPDEELPRPAP